MDLTRALGDRSLGTVLEMEMDLEMDLEVELEVQILEGRKEVLSKLPSLLLEMGDTTMEGDTTRDSTMEAKDSTPDSTMEGTTAVTATPTARADRSAVGSTIVRGVSTPPFMDKSLKPFIYG